MSNYRDVYESDQLALCNLHLAAYRHAISLVPEVIKVIKHFDGKVVNKRINTALNEVDKDLRLKSEYGMLSLQMSIQGRYITTSKSNTGSAHAYERALYLNESSICLCRLSIENSSHPEKNCVVDGKIVSATIINELEAISKSMEFLIVKVEDQIKIVKELSTRRDQLREDVNVYKESLNWMVADYFDLNWY